MKMFKVIKNSPATIIFTLIVFMFLSSCEKFFNPDQGLNITEDQLFDDWYEYRSTEMGLYGLQQKLVEQLLILGELRGDLLTINPNADVDMVEIYNFNVSKNNKYASPINFFKLISASNNFIRILEREHPEVLDPESPVTNYDKLYGEALCMRAWAYFNAVRIYGKVPYIHESLVTIEEINGYIDSPGSWVDSVYIGFSRDGYYNDTIYNHPVTLEKKMFDLDLIIEVFAKQLETEIKAVGVNHYINNNDETWEVTIWNTYALHALLGQMYLTQGDYTKAIGHFNQIVYNETDNYRYQIDGSFSATNWRSIFANIDAREHIYTIWFDKSYFQQNEFQSFFEPWPPHTYMLKPSRIAINNWETVWRNQQIIEDLQNPRRSRMAFPGIPSDFYRGYGSSYLYLRNGIYLSGDEYMMMLDLKSKGDQRSVDAIMAEVDTIVFKYSINRNLFDQDANYIVYRAAGIHLNMAEIYTWWAYPRGGEVKPYVSMALDIINDGANYGYPPRVQVGVRGRVGLAGGNDGIRLSNITYIHDPFTNEILDYIDLSGNLQAKQLYLEEQILDERARELAFEGERFYDLIRVAKRRMDIEPDFLARKVSAKYPAEQRDQIYTLLLDEKNWYINYFE
jgi:hypothetical protein